MSAPYLGGAIHRLRRHHREAGLHDRQPERHRLLRLRRLLQLADTTRPLMAPGRRRSGPASVRRGPSRFRLRSWPAAMREKNPRAHRRHRLHRHRPPDDLSRPVRRPAHRRPAAQGLAVVPGGRPGRSAAAASPPTSPSAWAAWGCDPILVGAVGDDFADYRVLAGAARRGHDSVRVSESTHTARFLCTTDADHNQIASFYTGAMTEARQIELGRSPSRRRRPRPGADRRQRPRRRCCGTPTSAAARHPVRRRPLPAARADGRRATIRLLVDGAAYLFTNEYEKGLIEQKTGWSDEEMLDRVGVRVTTLGPKGVAHRPARARADRTSRPPKERPRPTRPASATPSGPASSPASPGACRWSVRPSSAACWPPTCSRRVGTQEYELAPAGLHGRASPTPTAYRRRGPPRRRRPRSLLRTPGDRSAAAGGRTPLTGGGARQ